MYNTKTIASIMVKNMKGGNRHKKLARKNVQDENVRHRARLADKNEPCEMYATVTKMYGQGNCEVKCNDGVTRICVIRKKFKGRNKRANTVVTDAKLLVGLRDWEVLHSERKQKCDLLEVYERYQYDDIKRDPRCDWGIIGTSVDVCKDTENSDVFTFDFGIKDEVIDELIGENKVCANSGVVIEHPMDGEINFDDI